MKFFLLNFSIIPSIQKKFFPEKIQTFIINNPLWKGVLILGGGTLLGQGIAIISAPIISRLYSPADFGALGLFSSILSIAVIFVTFKYEFAIPISESNNESANLLALCTITTILVTILFAILLFYFGPAIFHFFNAEIISSYSLLLIIGIFGVGIYQSLNYWAIRKQDYKRITTTKINQSLFGSISKIVFGLLSLHNFGLLIGYLIANIAGIGTYVRAINKHDRSYFSSISLREMKRVLLKHKSFPIFTAPSSLIFAISQQLPVFMLSSLFGMVVLGNYILAYQILSLPYALIATSMAQVFYGEAAKNARENPVFLKSQYLDTTKKLFLISLVIIILPSLTAPFLFPVIFGNSWTDAGIFCVPLALVACSQFVMSPTSKLSMYGYNHWDLGVNIVRILLIFGGFFIAKLLNFDPFTALTIYGSISIAIYLALFLLNIKAINALILKSN